MTGLLNAQGEPIKHAAPAKKVQAATYPKVGEAFGMWAGRDESFLTLPGGGVMQFDLSKLTLADYRAMRQHYQLGSSLNVLSFVMHQIDWDIECEDQKIAEFLHQEIEEHWTPFIRGISQAFWAGYSPIAVNYRNGDDGRVHIDKFKDLIPEECRVEWRTTEGWAPEGSAKPKIYNYNGFRQNGFWTPPENTMWYPLLMENGDYYGRKLLKPAFPAWFFSNLIHLFANRYFERFGEPLPVGRARFGDDVDMGNGTMVNGKEAMERIVQNIRNRAVVVLPSDRDPNTKEYDYSIEYLESQMRGADFERYLSRLDEEMSLSVFTPILLFRTADVGSYNLGQAHLRIFQQMLNSIAGDLQFYVQNFLVERLRILNFGPKSPRARWVYRKQGQGDIDTYKELMNEMVRQGYAKPDLEELGAIVGLTFNEIEQLTADPLAPGTDPNNDPKSKVDPKNDPKGDPKPKDDKKPQVKAAKDVLNEAVVRAAREVGNGNKLVTLGYKNRVMQALEADGFDAEAAQSMTDALYAKVNTWMQDAAPVAESGAEMKGMLDRVMDAEIQSIS